MVQKDTKKLQKRQAAYEKLKFYKDICEIRRFIYKITQKFPKTYIRLISQMRDAARSAKQNIREGYKKGTLGEFIHSINISRGSLEELSGDVEDCKEDGLISDEEFVQLEKLFRSADYLSHQYIKALYQMKATGSWKTPRSRKK